MAGTSFRQTVLMVSGDMTIMRFHYPFVGRSGATMVVEMRAEVTLKRMGLRLCGVCFKTHTLRAKCQNGKDIVSPPDSGDGVVRFVLYDLTKPQAPSCSKYIGQRTVRSIPPKCRLGFSQVLKGDLDKEESIGNAIRSWSVPGALVLDTIKSFPRGKLYGRDGLCAQHLLDCLSGVVVAISDDLVSSITQVVNLFLYVKYPKILVSILLVLISHRLLSEGGICPIVVGIVWRRLLSKVSAILICHSLDSYLDDIQFGVRMSGGGEAVLHVVNRLIKGHGDDVSILMLLVDFKNAFNLVDQEVMLLEVRLRCPAISRLGVQQGDPLALYFFSLALHSLICKIRDFFNLSLQAWYMDHGAIIGDTLIMGKVLELIMEDGPRCGLHLNVNKTEVFLPKENLSSRLADFNFSSELVMKRLAKTIMPMDITANINDPQGDLPPYLLYSGGGVYSAGEVLNYSFLASRLQSASLQSVPLFIILKSCSACSKVFTGDIYGDHVVSCTCIIGIKHRHNAMRDTLVNIYFWSGISARKEVNIGLGVGCDKSLGPADMLLYSWDEGLDVCMDLIGSSPLTHTWMVDFVPGSAVVNAAHRKQVKYEGKRVPFEQRNNPPQHPRIVYPPILDINYFRCFLDILQNYDPMDDEPMCTADHVVASPLSFAITIHETANEFAIKASGIFLYKTLNQAYRLLEDKVLLKLDWAKIQKTKSSLKKTVAFAAEGSNNSDTDKIMARMDAMTMKMDARYKDFQSRSKQSNLDDDDIPMSREEEAKFMQTFCRTHFYNDYRDRDSNRDNCPFSCNALSDLGTSINLMSYSLYAKLSLETLRPTKISIILADRSFQYPVGIAGNMLVEVGKFTFPADFVILEMEEDSEVPLILGRPFLHTANAVIRVKQKQLNLEVGTERMIFHIDSTMKHSYSNDDTCFSIDVINEILEEDFDALLDEGIVLRHKVSETGLEVDKEKIDVISKLPPPTNIKGIRSFLGHAGFYRRFIKEFLKIASPLTKLLEKDTPFEFNDECHNAFKILKEKLTCAPMIVSPNWNLSFKLMCDASDFAVRAILCQKEDFENYLASDIIPKGMTYQQKKKKFSDIKHYFWEEPYLSKVCSDGIDFMGPFSKSYKFEYILVAVDYVSKWAEAQALPTNDAKVVITFLKKPIYHFGMRKALISDRGTYFYNKIMEKTMKRYGVNHRFSTSYHSQTGSQVENTTKALKRILEKTVKDNPAIWSRKFDDALWAFRTAYKTPTGTTPYKLIYGKNCHFPFEIENRAYWALKNCNPNLTAVCEKRMF
nr:reverse transcriptase domain-containing protein [Tanacetum cinerariifolium]